MIAQQSARTQQTAFLDDELQFLSTIKLWQEDMEMEEHATSSVEECLSWVRNGLLDVVVCDLRMPGRDGVSVLEEIRALDHRIRLVVLTAFEPTQKEAQRLEAIGVEIYYKTRDLNSLLSSLVEGELAQSTQQLLELQERVETLESVHREWTHDLISQLEMIPDLEKAMIADSDGAFSVAELIDDIRTLRPRGLEHIRLWRKALARLRKVGKRA